MKYGAILDENDIVQNIIVIENDQDPSVFGAIEVQLPVYIGQVYIPPEPEPSLEDRVFAIESAIERGLSL